MSSSPAPDDLGPWRHFGRALAHAVSPATLRAALEFRRADPTVALALRVGFAGMIALVGCGLLGLTDVAGFAALGTLSSAFLRYEPYRLLAPKLAGVVVAVVGCAAFGATLGALGLNTWVQIVLLSVAAGGIFGLLQAFRITGPGAAIMIFAAAGAAGFADSAADVGLVTLVTAVGAVIGWLVALSPAIRHPHAPARVAVARALEATAAHANGATADADVRRAIAQAREALALTPRRQIDDHTAELAGMLDAADRYLESGDPAALPAADLADELRKVQSTSRAPASTNPAPLDPAVYRRSRGFLRDGIDQLRNRTIYINGARMALACLAAGLLAAGLGLAHPLWATIGALTVLQGAHYNHTAQRAAQRLAGNVIGAVLAAGIFALDLDYWPLIVIVIICQTGGELFVTRNYGVAQVFITAMALLLTGLGESVDATTAATRVGDTLIGVVVGVVVAALTLKRGDHSLFR